MSPVTDFTLHAQSRQTIDRLKAELQLLTEQRRLAICALHQAGMSYRKIAVLLRLSHQRLHQIVKET